MLTLRKHPFMNAEGPSFLQSCLAVATIELVWESLDVIILVLITSIGFVKKEANY